jgi:hypothetical protein
MNLLKASIFVLILVQKAIPAKLFIVPSQEEKDNPGASM